jgi:hypothetical protein
VEGRRPGAVSSRHVLASTVRVSARAHRGDVTPAWLQRWLKTMMGDDRGDLAVSQKARTCPSAGIRVDGAQWVGARRTSSSLPCDCAHNSDVLTAALPADQQPSMDGCVIGLKVSLARGYPDMADAIPELNDASESAASALWVAPFSLTPRGGFRPWRMPFITIPMMRMKITTRVKACPQLRTHSAPLRRIAPSNRLKKRLVVLL